MVCYQTMIGVAYLQENGVTHGDLHSGNIAFTIPGLEKQSEHDVMDYFSNPECTAVVPRVVSGATSSLPKYLVTPASMMDYMVECLGMMPDSSSICVKIMDFGNAFRSIDERPPPITPIFIRAPEIFFSRRSSCVLDDTWGMKSDIWSLACTMYEIVNGFIMFHGLGQEDALIIEMIKVSGALPERWKPYWNPHSNGTWETDPDASWTKRQDNFRRGHLNDASLKSANDFIHLLRSMLILDPNNRPLVSELLQHPWFDGVRERT